MRQQILNMGRASGFSLVELMVVLTIAAIMTRYGLASYSSLTAKERMAGEINEFVLAVQYARAEAIREGTNVTICASSTGNTCSSSTTNWNQGWIVFADVNGNGAVDTSTDVIYRVQAGLTGTDLITSSRTSAFTFNRLGLLTTVTSSTTISTTTAEMKATNSSADASVYQCAFITSLGSVTTASGASC